MYMYMISDEKIETLLFYDLFGGDVFTICFVGVLMNSTVFFSIVRVYCPLCLKIDNTVFSTIFYDFLRSVRWARVHET